MQRFNSALELSLHFHLLAPDGVFETDGAKVAQAAPMYGHHAYARGIDERDLGPVDLGRDPETVSCSRGRLEPRVRSSGDGFGRST